jgi:hypothetical protein
MVVGKGPWASQLPRNEADMGKVLDRFHPHEGVLQGATGRDDPVVGKQDRIMIDDQRLDAGGHVVRSGGGLGREGDGAKRHDDF